MYNTETYHKLQSQSLQYTRLGAIKDDSLEYLEVNTGKAGEVQVGVAGNKTCGGIRLIRKDTQHPSQENFALILVL